jgi:8-oxo-dGTP pyrophosphatase MutT (NUDIX family)
MIRSPGGALKQEESDEVNSISTLESREIYRNQWLRLREDKILRSNGKEGIYSVVEKDDCAIILPLQDGKVWLVEQFRYTIQERAIELPQGGWEIEIDDPEELARGELKEETGLHAAEMVYIGFLWIAYGFARQKQHVFFATGLTLHERDPDDEEHDMTILTKPLEEFEQMMLDGRIRDASTVGAWGLYLMWRSRQREAGSQ